MYRSALTSANRQVHKRTLFRMLNEVNTSHAQSQSETVWARAERCKAATPWTAGNKLPIYTIWCGHLSSIFTSVIVFSLIFSFICSMCTCKIWTKPMQAGANSAPRRAPGQRVAVIRFGPCTENHSSAGNARAFNKWIRFDWKWLLNTAGVWRLLGSTGHIKTRLRLRRLGRSLFPSC